MSDLAEKNRPNKTEVPERIEDVFAEVTALLRRQRLIEGLAREQIEEEGLSEQQSTLLKSSTIEQGLNELREYLNRLHPADIAYVLEALPIEERLYLWDLVRAGYDGEILVEVSDAVRESLISAMDTEELVAATESLPTDEIAALAPDLPQEVIDDLFQGLPIEEREELRTAMSFDEDMVGALMDFEDVQVRGDVTLQTVFRYLRRFDELPTQTDQLFVVDKEESLLGVLPIHVLLVNDENKLVNEVMLPPPIILQQHENARDAANAFERYDLVSAPVVDTNGKLVGRVTVDEILDFIKERAGEEVLAHAGLREEEDIFASVWKSFQNRWAWLAVNLITAFIASRVIGLFEDTIVQLVALATLMPIVAGIGGNSGNQTITMIVRSMALGQISSVNARQLLRKELLVNLLNGVVWGGVMGLVAFWLYQDLGLGLVMVLAMILNMLLAALMGVLIPVIMTKLGRDPALGSSVLITAVTDSGGFFIFLGLATLFLM
ncbi:MAG: magnesium transporter [Burkholderiales bacterium]|jgi:magnesium transporter|nr:magnesium transporter [Burkholderiales bacterium]